MRLFDARQPLQRIGGVRGESYSPNPGGETGQRRLNGPVWPSRSSLMSARGHCCKGQGPARSSKDAANDPRPLVRQRSSLDALTQCLRLKLLFSAGFLLNHIRESLGIPYMSTGPSIYANLFFLFRVKPALNHWLKDIPASC